MIDNPLADKLWQYIPGIGVTFIKLKGKLYTVKHKEVSLHWGDRCW